MRKITMLLCCLLFSIGYATAQTQKVSGVVLSKEDGQPVIGASVLVEGTTMGTITDIDGHFELLRVPNDAKNIQVSYVGMESTTEAIKSVMKIILAPDSELLEEVVVVGYGSGKKVGTVIGSISTVKSDKIALKPTANAMDALQGQVSGLQVYTSSGEPGSTSSIRLRGVGSLSAGNSPLFVLDGVPVGGGILTTMNPNDIENITVLKDASATSIYGSRAANGVVYITSKRGKMSEKAVVTLYGSVGWSKLARRIGDPMSSNELLAYQLRNGILDQETHDTFKASGYNTKWEDYFFDKNVPVYSTNLSIQGGTAKTRYYVSGSYFDQKGIAPRSQYDRYTLRSNIDTQANDWLKFGLNIGGSYDHNQSSPFTKSGSNNLNGGILGTLLNQPYYNPYGESGENLDVIPGLNRYSPYFLANKMYDKANTAQINTSAYVEIKPIEGLTIKSQFGLEAYDWRSSYIQYSTHPSSTQGGKSIEDFSRNAKLTSTNTVEYKFSIDDDHKFTLLAGHEGVNNDNHGFSAASMGQNDDRLTLLKAGTEAEWANMAHSKSTYNYLSFFGRIDYSWKDKYFADFSVRNDESSRFGKDNRSATFAAGGLMWNIKKEDFMEDVDFITDLKLKGSVGSTGNSEIGNYAHLGLVGTTQYNGQGGWLISNPENDKLGWETQILTNVGFDVTFFNKFQFDLTYYRRKTKDMLMSVPLPYTTGFGSQMSNVGSMLNTGVELSMNLTLYQDRDWFVALNANYAYNKNKITKLFYGLDEWIIPNTSVSYRVGHPVEMYMPIYAGVDPEDGLQMWEIPGTDEVTKDKRYADAGLLDQPTGKYRYAPHNGGFNIIAQWKGLSLNADFSWVYGKYMINNDRFFSENSDIASMGVNQSKVMSNEWQEVGQVTNIPKFGSERSFDTHLLENASFLRLKNLGIGYELPKNLVRKTQLLERVRFNMNFRNMLTITPYKGADPEMDSNLSMGAYPNTKQISIGAEITF